MDVGHVDHVKKKTERISLDDKVYPIYSNAKSDQIIKQFFKIRNPIEVHYDKITEDILLYSYLTVGILGASFGGISAYKTRIGIESEILLDIFTSVFFWCYRW